MAKPKPDAESGQRRLTIHLGVQKTGTTSIQRYLRQNEANLARRLVLRLPVEDSAMRPLGRAAVEYSLKPCEDTRATLIEAISTVRDGLPDNGLPVLISHENLAGAMPGNGGETGLYPALPEILGLLDQGFAEFAVDYVVYTRRMVKWKPSVWAQAVRTDGYARSWDEFATETASLPGWNNLIKRLQKAVGEDRVTQIRLEDETRPDHPGALLLQHVGLDEDTIGALLPLDKNAMERLPDSVTEFIRRLNSLAINPHARAKVAELAARLPQLFNSDYPPIGVKAKGRP